MKLALPLIASLLLFPTPIFAEAAYNSPKRALETRDSPVIDRTTIAQNANQSAPELAPEKQQYLQELTQAITVKISTSNNGGSGVLIGREGNEYLILTNAHVVRGGETFEIQTSDGQVHPGSLVQDATNSNDDLALIKFSSSQEYEIAAISTVPLETEILTYAGGYASETGTLVTKTGQISQYPDQGFKEGYRIGFTSNIEQGMSGGPILDAVEGDLIGINGYPSSLSSENTYIYQDGTAPSQSEIETMRQLSWGIPINTFLAQVNSDILAAYNLPLPETSTGVEITYTGWIGELEQKAQQITVRIDSSSGANGSGVIIAKEGNIYTVLTAAHVVCERDDFTQPCQDKTYQILAPDGEAYPVEASTIRRQDGVDLAVVKFNSNEIFQVAQLADYPLGDNDVVFVAGYPRLSSETPAEWLLSLGYGREREQGLIEVSDNALSSDDPSLIGSLGSVQGGYEMVYTSITYGGMSGGAVLDRDGRVIGIHGFAEGQTTLESQENSPKIQLGYSLGIPVNTFIGLRDQLQVNSTLSIQDNKTRELNTADNQAFQAALLGAEIPQGNATAEIWLERGNQLWRLRRYDQAVEAFDKVIALAPEFIHLGYYGKALALIYRKQYETAIENFELATKTKPNFDPSFLSKSAVLKNLNRLEEALVAINSAIDLQQQADTANSSVNFIANSYNEKGLILDGLKRYREAEEAYNLAIQINPRSSFYNNRGLLNHNQGKLELAAAEFNKAISLNPGYAYAYNNRGRVYRDQGQVELALADYNRALEINPESAETYNNRGNIYLSIEQVELVLADFDRALEINPEFAEAYMNRGLVYRNQGQIELALADYNRALEINPESAEAYVNRGVFYENQGQADLALADYNRALEINPESAEAYGNLGVVHMKLNNIEEARLNWQKAYELFVAQGNTAGAEQVANILQQLPW